MICWPHDTPMWARRALWGIFTPLRSVPIPHNAFLVTLSFLPKKGQLNFNDIRDVVDIAAYSGYTSDEAKGESCERQYC